MENTALAMLAAGVIIVLGVLLMKKVHKTKVSGIIPLLLLGIVVGPLSKALGYPLFDPSEYTAPITALVTFALIIVLFDSGYSIEWSRLRRELVPALILTALGVAVTAAAVSLFAYYIMHLSWQLSLLLSALISSTDLTIVSPLMQSMKMSTYSKEVLDLEGALNSVFAAIIAIVAVGMIRLESFTAKEIAQTFLSYIFVGAAFGLILGYLIVLAVRHLKLEEKPHIISIGAVLLVYAVTELIGASGIVAALIVGIVFRNTGQDLPRVIKSYSSDMEILLVVFVYVLLGTLLDFSTLFSVAFIASAFVILVVLSRIGAAEIYAFGFKEPHKQIIYLSGPRGIVCAVLALSYASQFPNATNVLVMVFFTILVTTLLSSLMPVCGHVKAAEASKEKRNSARA